MDTLRGKELIARYKSNYGIPDRIQISEEMILRHWELEKQLAQDLLKSKSHDRFETTVRCYNRLYSELYWLNSPILEESPLIQEKVLSVWKHLIGDPPKKIYEIGSGKGKLITYLAVQSYECKATEITNERGRKHVETFPNLTWRNSDGVHCDNYEDPCSFDVAISTSFIEHLHPEDVPAHFNGISKILKRDGKYIFITPHILFGPSDISIVFKSETAQGLHLKEYSYKDLEFIRK